MKREIFGIKAPKKQCTDKKCPFHGQLTVKKELFRGQVIKRDVHHSATIEWSRSCYLPKYERYELRRSRLRVHNPPCLDAQAGQMVLAAKSRPLSKTKNHVIIQIFKKEEKKEEKEEKRGDKKEEKKEETKGEKKGEKKEETKEEKEEGKEGREEKPAEETKSEKDNQPARDDQLEKGNQAEKEDQPE